jgi:hypothetical protein
VTAERQLCLVSANLAVRRSLLESVGLFAPELQRVKDSIGSMEDHELLTRCWRAGKQGLYLPTLLASTSVPANRMRKSYHRRWHAGHGAFCGLMRFIEEADQDGRYVGPCLGDDAVTLFGMPAFVYRRIGEEAAKWFAATLRRQQAISFMYENNIRFLVNYIRTRYRQERARATRSAVAEIRSFAANLLRKKVRTALAARRAA